jgi:hypothetical protein
VVDIKITSATTPRMLPRLHARREFGPTPAPELATKP